MQIFGDMNKRCSIYYIIGKCFEKTVWFLIQKLDPTSGPSGLHTQGEGFIGLWRGNAGKNEGKV